MSDDQTGQENSWVEWELSFPQTEDHTGIFYLGYTKTLEKLKTRDHWCRMNKN